MDIAELSRRLENVIRIGTIFAVDLDNALVRVASGKNDTGWIPWFEHRAGTTRTWDPPTVGEQVMLLSPSGELGAAIALVGIYRATHPAPSAVASLHVTEYPDGAKISYDHASGALEVTGIKTALVDAAADITLRSGGTINLDAAEDITLKSGTQVVFDAPITKALQELIAEGLFSYMSGMSGQGGAAGARTTIRGHIDHIDGDLTSNGVVVHLHVHVAVTPGPGLSGGPQ